jgi:bacillolysin
LFARRIVTLLASLGFIVGALAVPSGAGSTGRLPSRARVAVHEETGRVRLIGSAPGEPIARPASVDAAAAPAAIARAFLERFGGEFGIEDQAEELRVTSAGTAPGDRSVVRFQQVHQGVPVLGGELVVNLDEVGNMLSASGEALPSLRMSVTPQVSPSEARDAAASAVARARAVPATGLDTSAPRVWIYDSRLLGGPGLDRPALVWRMDVEGEGPTGPIDELVLVDARLGNVVVHFDQIAHARDRRVCDANSTSGHVPCVSPVRTEGGSLSAVQDVNDAYDFSGDTYDFFFENLGRDSLDDSGMILFSTVRFCPSPAECPFQNAFWNGQQMVYGAGFAVDDVVGHELTHGVTEFSSQLFYYYQSGAINEALSDVFGEFVDLTNGAGTDTPAVRWLLGEDVPGFGAVRDMEHPPAFGDPDRMTSPHYTADLNEVDGGGVHTNSGVNNKAAFLITDGGTFNGRTVTGLGIPKSAHIYYEVATNMLTSASDYADLASALPQACTNLIGTAGITSADCTEVSEAVAAVEMNQSPPAAPNPVAPVCSPGQAPTTDLLLDDLENPGSGNWVLQTTAGGNTWFYPQPPEFTFATSGDTNFWGYNQSSIADYSIRMTSDVAIPSGSAVYLRFNHAYGFDDDPSGAYDGGVLEYSTNGGGSWIEAGSLFTHGGYPGTIAGGFGNPLAGRNAFVRESNGYISSRADLSSLAGQSVRFRFRIGTDNSFDDYGWFVDDIHIYTCPGGPPPPPPPPTSSQSVSIADATKKEPDKGKRAMSFRVSLSAAATSPVTVTYATKNGTANAPKDFTAVTGTLTFPAGSTARVIKVAVRGDTRDEKHEKFQVLLSGPAGATLADGAAAGKIKDND